MTQDRGYILLYSVLIIGVLLLLTSVVFRATLTELEIARGSELVGLTTVQAADDSFPAVDELTALAASVKGILGG